VQIRDRIKEFRRVRASELIPNPRNWRTHPKKQREALAGILGEIGYADALIARETDAGLELIDGHLRKETTPDQEVPVLVLDVNEEEANKLLLTLDPLAAMAEAEAVKLKDLVESVETQSEALEKMIADTAAEFDAFEKVDIEEGPEAEIDQAEELREQWGTELGQLWKIGEHRLLCGDSTDRECVERVMADDLADCVFTSPPYAVGIDYGDSYTDDISSLREMLPNLARIWFGIVKPGGYSVVNFGDIVSGGKIIGETTVCQYPMALEYWPVFRHEGWVLWSQRIWCKPIGRVSAPWCASSNRGATNWEHLWTWRKPGGSGTKPKTGNAMSSMHGWCDSSSMEGVAVGKGEHGAGMATGIAAWMIHVHTEQGALVHEPFCGTGTTIIACEQLGRRCRAIEISPGYVAVTLQRCTDAGMECVKA